MTARAGAKRSRGGLVAALVGVLAACSSGGAASTTTTAAPTTVGSSVAASSTEPAPASTATTPPLPVGQPGDEPMATAPPSPTGVPGIDATDEFSAAWARYGATVQIVAVAVNFGELDSAQSATLELESAPTVVGAVAEIRELWPAELVDERDVALDRYLGPYERRAEKAVDALAGAGVDDAGQTQLRTTWLHVLATRNPDVPTVTVDLPDDLAARVAAGAVAFDAAVTPWGSDPSLTANLDDIPKTKAYLAAHCPDLASIGIGDDV